jgi:hypothetical protein
MQYLRQDHVNLPWLILLSLLATLPLNAATKVSLREALEVRTEAASFKLPQGKTLEVIKEDGGILTCEIAGQQFQVAADKTDYQDVIAAKPPAPVASPPLITPPQPGAPAPATSNNVLDLLSTEFKQGDILYTLPDRGSKDRRIIVPKNYDKTLDDIPVNRYTCTLTPDNLVAGLNLITETIGNNRYNDLLDKLKQKYPVTKEETPPPPANMPPGAKYYHFHWQSGDTRIKVRQQLGHAKGKSSRFAINVDCQSLRSRQFYNQAEYDARNKTELPALTWQITIYETPRQTALELWRSPALTADPETVKNISIGRKRVNFTIESPSGPDSNQMRVLATAAANPQEYFQLHPMPSEGDLANNIVMFGAVNLALDLSDKFKIPSGHYFSDGPHYLELGKPLAIPLYSFTTLDKTGNHIPVAVITARKK